MIGSPDTIRKKLHEYAAANIDQIILLNQSGKTSHADICSSLALFSREMMPEFQAMEPEHQAWKQAVKAGKIRLEDIDVNEHKKLAVTDVIDADKRGQLSQAQIQASAERNRCRLYQGFVASDKEVKKKEERRKKKGIRTKMPAYPWLFRLAATLL